MGNFSNSGQINWIFQNSATQAGDGFILNVIGGWNTLDIEITGSENAAGTIIFSTKSIDGGNFYRTLCYNKTTAELAHTTTVIGQVWQMELAGVIQVKVFVSPTAGSITVKGRVVN